MTESLLDHIITLTEDLPPEDRRRLTLYLQAVESGQVFLCKTERDIFLAHALEARQSQDNA